MFQVPLNSQTLIRKELKIGTSPFYYVPNPTPLPNAYMTTLSKSFGAKEVGLEGQIKSSLTNENPT